MTVGSSKKKSTDYKASITIVGKSEVCHKFCQVLEYIIKNEKNPINVQKNFVPTLVHRKNNNLNIDVICSPSMPSYIVVVVEASEPDPLKIVAEEIGYLPTRYFTKKCVDIVIWEENKVKKNISKLNLCRFLTKFQIFVHFIMSNVETSKEMNVLKLYNRLKAIYYHPEITTFNG